MTRFNAMWRGAFYILVLVLEKLPLLFELGFKLSVAFWCVDEQDFAACILILINFTLNSRVAFSGLRYWVMLLGMVEHILALLYYSCQAQFAWFIYSFNVFAAFRYICDQADRADILCFFIMLDLFAIMSTILILLVILMFTIPDLLAFINTFIIIEPYCYFVYLTYWVATSSAALRLYLEILLGVLML